MSKSARPKDLTDKISFGLRPKKKYVCFLLPDRPCKIVPTRKIFSWILEIGDCGFPEIHGHFSTSPLKPLTQFNKTWQEASSQCPLPCLCFSGWSENQDGCPGLWLAETCSISPLKPLSRIQWNLMWKQDLNVLYQVCVSCIFSQIQIK